jgi:hypothetical protein
MKVTEVIDVARQWVDEQGSALPGFQGAYLAGSINEMAKDDPFPLFRDVDVYVVVDDPSQIAVPQEKFVYRGVLLERVTSSVAEHRSAETILASINAASVARANILSDPTGLLHELQSSVAAQYAHPQWIAARCQGQKQFIAYMIGQADSAHDPVFFLGFTVLYLGGLVALADGHPPTVRRCLAVSGDLLHAHGRPDLHESILALLGSASMDRTEVVGHLESCIPAFDTAVQVLSTPFYTSWNLHEGSRPYLIDGSWEMIDAGQHREAMFWISMMHSVAHTAIRNDAPETDKAHYGAAFDRLRAALGVPADQDWHHRVELARRLTEEVAQFADARVASRG